MKAVLWPYRFADMKATWAPQFQWLASALLRLGCEVRRHPGFVCCGLDGLDVYDPSTDNPCDIAIYNHADQSELTGNVIRSNRNWFVKPTVPDNAHTTLDEIGYGPYSTVAYVRPPIDEMNSEEVDRFFDTDVENWIYSRSIKYGRELSMSDTVIDFEDYYLVIGQCAGDSVVTRHDFGDYVCKLTQVVRELVRVDGRPVVVKLHPYMDGKGNPSTRFSDGVAASLRDIDGRVHVFAGARSVHDFIPRARAVLLANSGAGFEAMMHGKPIIAWGAPEYHWVCHDLRHLADMRRAVLVERWHNVQAQRAFLFWYLRKYCYNNEASAIARVSELLGLGR